MDIFPFPQRVVSIAAILCLLEGNAPAQTVDHEAPLVQSANASNGQATSAGKTVPSSEAGPYTTMCVRSCDGFYFLLRQNAHPEYFELDAQMCASECGAEARLFYFPFHGGDPATMIDLAGRKYADEPHAFAFRKAIAPGCVPANRRPGPERPQSVIRGLLRKTRRVEPGKLPLRREGQRSDFREYYASDARAQKSVR